MKEKNVSKTDYAAEGSKYAPNFGDFVLDKRQPEDKLLHRITEIMKVRDGHWLYYVILAVYPESSTITEVRGLNFGDQKGVVKRIFLVRLFSKQLVVAKIYVPPYVNPRIFFEIYGLE